MLNTILFKPKPHNRIMLWIDYTSTPIPSSFSDLAHHLEQQHRKVLMQKYCKNQELLYYERALPALARQLPAVLWALEGNVKNKVIVDLGCGSTTSFDTPSYAYEPWLGRLLHEAGAKVVGIDAHREVLKEDFDTHCIDLWGNGTLNFLKTKKIDLIHAASFFDSPGVTLGKGTEEMKKRIEKELGFYKGTLLYA